MEILHTHQAGCAPSFRIAIPDSAIGDEGMAGRRRRTVFVSYHHREDQEYKDRFVRMMNDHIVDKSVDTGDIIDRGLPVDEVRHRVRDEYIAEATVTVVLIGRCTWQRKHVDWEISASLIDTPHNDRCGLLGIRLPTHTDFRDAEPGPPQCKPRSQRLDRLCIKEVCCDRWPVRVVSCGWFPPLRSGGCGVPASAARRTVSFQPAW